MFFYVEICHFSENYPYIGTLGKVTIPYYTPYIVHVSVYYKHMHTRMCTYVGYALYNNACNVQ